MNGQQATNGVPTHEVVRLIGGSNSPKVGSLVDASKWAMRADLEQQGNIRPLGKAAAEKAAADAAALAVQKDRLELEKQQSELAADREALAADRQKLELERKAFDAKATVPGVIETKPEAPAEAAPKAQAATAPAPKGANKKG